MNNIITDEELYTLIMKYIKAMYKEEKWQDVINGKTIKEWVDEMNERVGVSKSVDLPYILWID